MLVCVQVLNANASYGMKRETRSGKQKLQSALCLYAVI